MLWAATRSCNILDTEEIKTICVKAYDWLGQITAQYWSRHGFDKSVNVNHVTKNMTESFNNQIDEYRLSPILTLLERLKQFRKRHQ